MKSPAVDSPIARISTPWFGVLVVALFGALLALIKAEAWFQSFRGSGWSSILGAALASLVFFIVQVLAEGLLEVVWGVGHRASRVVAILAGIAYFAAWYTWASA